MNLNNINNKLRIYLANAYDALKNKGAFIPDNKNLVNLANSVYTIENNLTVVPPEAGEMTGIIISKLPNKLDYREGEDFDAEGLEIKASYNSGITRDITNACVIEIESPLQVNNDSVTVIYGDYKLTFAIKVYADIEEIPEETVFLYHFDSNIVNEISGTSEGTVGSPAYSDGKFGRGLYQSSFQIQTDKMPTMGNVTSGAAEATYSFWFNLKNYPTTTSNTELFSLPKYGVLNRVLFTKNYLYMYGFNNNLIGKADQYYYFDSNFDITAWHHLALVFKDGYKSLFLDGKRVMYGPCSSQSDKGGIYLQNSKVYYDELLMSSKALYTADFEIPKNKYGGKSFLERLYIEKMPNKLVYPSGELFSLDGAIVKATYSDGYIKDVTSECLIENGDKILTTEDTYKMIYYTDGDITKKIPINVGVYIEDDIENPSGEVLEQILLANYIEATGTQYIDTEIVPNSNTEIEIELAFVNPGNMGWGSSGGQESFYWGASAANGFHSSVSTNYTATLANIPFDNEKHIFNLKNGSQKLDGIEFATGTIGNTAIAGQTIYLGAFHAEWTTTGPDSFNQVKIYSFKFYENGVLIKDLKPAYHHISKEVGLYDKVNNRFYENKGTDYFLWG